MKMKYYGKRKIYNNGFYDYYYQCQSCRCESVSLKHLGGFQPPDLICDSCSSIVTNNKIEIVPAVKENIVEKVVVDFAMLNDSLYTALPENLTIPEWQNIKLFFHELKTNQEFKRNVYLNLKKLR